MKCINIGCWNDASCRLCGIVKIFLASCSFAYICVLPPRIHTCNLGSDMLEDFKKVWLGEFARIFQDSCLR